MRPCLAYLGILVLVQPPSVVGAQKVLMHHATPATVLDLLKAELLSNGFKVGDTSNNGALFTLDRGHVVQQSGPLASVHVVIELQVRYKVKSEGLEVSASEEAVGTTGIRSFDFRRRVESRAELANLQQLLDRVRVAIEARPTITDSVVTRDSTPY